jgi:hypothetical protein
MPMEFETGTGAITPETPTLNVTIYDFFGNPIETIMDEVPEHTEGVVIYDKKNLPSGIYNAVFRFGQQVKSILFTK